MDVGSIVTKLVLDAKEFVDGIKEARDKLTDMSEEAKKTTTSFENVAGHMESFGKQAKDLGDKLSVGVSLPLAGVATAAIEMSNKFNEAMANVATLIPGNEARVEHLKETVQSLAKESGKSTDDLAKSLYQVISAFGDTAHTEDMLTVATKASEAGLSSTKEAVDLLATAIKGYGLQMTDAQKVSDFAFETVKLGVTTFGELAGSMGRVIPMAAALKIKQEELWGAMSTLTGVIGNTDETTTALRATYQAFLKPSDEMATALGKIADPLIQQGKLTGDLVNQYKATQKELSTYIVKLEEAQKAHDTSKISEYKEAIKDTGKELGKIESGFGPAIIQTLGFQGALKAVAEQAGGNTAVLSDMFGEVRALNAVLALTGPQAEIFTEKTKKMYEVSGATTEAFKEQTEGINKTGHEWGKLKEQMEVLMQKIGDSLLPAFSRIITAISPLIEKVAGLVDTFSKLPAPIQNIAFAFGGLVIASGPVLSTVGRMSELFATLIKVGGVLSGVITAVASAFAPMKAAILGLIPILSTPPIGLIVLIGSLGLALVELYKHNEKFRNFVNGIISSIKNWLLSIEEVRKAWDALSSVWNKITGLFRTNTAEAGESIKSFSTSSTGHITNVKDSFNAFYSAVNKGTPDITNNTQKITGGFQELYSKLEGIKPANVNNLNPPVKDLAENTQKTTPKVDEIADSIKKLGDVSESSASSIKKVKESLKDIQESKIYINPDMGLPEALTKKKIEETHQKLINLFKEEEMFMPEPGEIWIPTIWINPDFQLHEDVTKKNIEKIHQKLIDMFNEEVTFMPEPGEIWIPTEYINPDIQLHEDLTKRNIERMHDKITKMFAEEEKFTPGTVEEWVLNVKADVNVGFGDLYTEANKLAPELDKITYGMGDFRKLIRDTDDAIKQITVGMGDLYTEADKLYPKIVDVTQGFGDFRKAIRDSEDPVIQITVGFGDLYSAADKLYPKIVDVTQGFGDFRNAIRDSDDPIIQITVGFGDLYTEAEKLYPEIINVTQGFGDFRKAIRESNDPVIQITVGFGDLYSAADKLYPKIAEVTQGFGDFRNAIRDSEDPVTQITVGFGDLYSAAEKLYPKIVDVTQGFGDFRNAIRDSEDPVKNVSIGMGDLYKQAELLYPALINVAQGAGDFLLAIRKTEDQPKKVTFGMGDFYHLVNQTYPELDKVTYGQGDYLKAIYDTEDPLERLTYGMGDFRAAIDDINKTIPGFGDFLKAELEAGEQAKLVSFMLSNIKPPSVGVTAPSVIDLSKIGVEYGKIDLTASMSDLTLSTDEADKSIIDLSLSLDNFKDKVEQTGGTVLDLGNVLNKLPGGFQKIAKVYNDVSIAIKDAATDQGKFIEDLIDVAVDVIPYISEFGDSLESAFNFLKEFSELSNPLSFWLVVFTDIYDQLKPMDAFLKSLNSTLQPTFNALLYPVTYAGQIFGQALIPVLQSLFPAFKQVGIMALNVAKGFAYAWNALATVANWFGAGLAYMDIGAFDTAIKHLIGLTWDQADAAANAAEAMRELTNVPEGFKVELAEFTAMAGQSLASSAVKGMSTTGGDTYQSSYSEGDVIIENVYITSNDPEQIWNDLKSIIQRERMTRAGAIAPVV